ncbi:Sec-independent protein translocase protein TatB [Bradyrhizobium sp.]|uniref:Sec-independent protein translocase protein TatB n=1 Tax=Bradyrhizobium sp. TaxID=376 RepID=UPI003C6AF89C
MFDIGWSEFALIAIVALIAIGPKELPGVLRMVGQWMGKARRMAAEFQGQFQEAMREAEMADLKKSFDEVKEAASGLGRGSIMTSLQKDVSRALDIEGIDKPAETKAETPAATIEPPVVPTTPAAPTAESFAEADAHVAETSAAETNVAETNVADGRVTETGAAGPSMAAEPLVITPAVQPAAVPQDLARISSEVSSSEGPSSEVSPSEEPKDAKAS